MVSDCAAAFGRCSSRRVLTWIVLTELWERLAGGDRSSIDSDILARCTALQASDRHPTAGALAGDLRRHLMHLPLKGVSNRSLPERWRKRRRRRPATYPLALILWL